MNVTMLMITEKGTTLGDKSSATDRLITDDVMVCVCHTKKLSMRLASGFAFCYKC